MSISVKHGGRGQSIKSPVTAANAATMETLTENESQKRMIGAYITFAVALGIVLSYLAVVRHFLREAGGEAVAPAVKTTFPEAQVASLREVMVTH